MSTGRPETDPDPAGSYLSALSPRERDAWILSRRSPRNRLDPSVPYAFVTEQEAGPAGTPVEAVTVFLTNRECPFRCLMCDLWQNTLEETVPDGAIAAQLRHVLEQLPPPGPIPRHLKLYNAGSFFDPRAIPPAEYPELARLAAPFERVIVECHPAFVGERLAEFRRLLGGSGAEDPPWPPLVKGGSPSTYVAHSVSSTPPPLTKGGPGGVLPAPKPPQLEVAMGLETAHPEILARLNKRMTLEQFRGAADRLRGQEIALRVFILVRPPWRSDAEGLEWAKRSLDFAFDCGAGVCALIPTRAGNGAMEALAAAGEWEPPTLRSLEAALDYGLELRAGRVFADLWDIQRFAGCPSCAAARIARLERINRSQSTEPQVGCSRCG
ncbi:MAG: hypothetical protein K0Q72_864 [Armatimonadetes bacterium]|nr:hypothetical protein [Armatimonadota bacterium]